MSDTPSGAAPDLTSDERIIRLLNRIREHLAAYVEGHAEDTSSWQNQRCWFDVDLSTKVLAMSVRRMGPKIVVLMEAQVPDSSYFVQHSAFGIDRLIRGEIAGDSWNWGILATHFLLLAAVYAVAWLLFLRRVDGSALDKVDLRRIGPIVVIMLAVCILLNLVANALGQNETAFQLADLTCNILGLFYQYSVLSVFVLEGKNEKVEQLLAQSVRQYNVSKENIELLNIKCHDLRHQIRAFHRDGKIDASLLGEIERVVDNYDCTVRIGNGALDVLLTEKSLLCRSKNIRFTCLADGAGLSYMDPYDLYALFGNALENAIEAAEQIDDPERRVIGLTMRAMGGFYTINLQNYVAGAVTLDEEGMPVTHKADKNNHGFGVRSMNMLAEKYGGALSYKAEGGVFNLNMVLPYRKEEKGEQEQTDKPAQAA